MRQLFLLMGAPASGKSSFIKEHHLESLTLSTDSIRKMYLGDSYDYVDGEFNRTIDANNQPLQKKVFELLYELTEQRMRNGITTFIDATNIAKKGRKRFMNLAKKHYYRVNVIPFGMKFNNNRVSYPTITLNELKQRNNNREYIVPETALESFYQRTDGIKLNNQYTIVYPDEFEDYISWRVDNVDNYDKLQVIGDIHSCGSALEELMKSYDENTYYVFTGDYFDRGIEPEKTLKILSQLADKSNVVFLEGNHEQHLRNWLLDDSYAEKAFNKTKTNLNHRDVKKIVSQLQPLKLLRYNGRYLLISHAGFDAVQLENEFDKELHNQLMLRPSKYFTKGIGGYGNDVDLSFEEKVFPSDLYQIHGHRNKLFYNADQFKRSYNLEQQVEMGRFLTAVNFTRDLSYPEFTYIRNAVFDKSLLGKGNQITVDDLEEDKFIKSKEVGNGVKVFNFTKKAFANNNWTNHTISARGLFMNENSEVVARGYDKFFNIDEKESLEELARQFNGHRVEISRKENGFLGIVSWCDELNDLIISSKGYGKEYSDEFKRILKNVLKENGNSLTDLAKYMRNKLSDCSLTFEVISNHDKHMVDYCGIETVYLLDVIKNTFEKQDLDSNNNNRDKVQNKFDFNVANKRYIDINSEKEFIELVESLRFSYNNEGYVITDMFTGKKVKVKTNWYIQHKKLRNYADKLLQRMKDKDLDGKKEFLKYRMDEFIGKPYSINLNIVESMYFDLENNQCLDNETFTNLFGEEKIDISRLDEWL